MNTIKPETPIFVGFRWQINQGGLMVRWDHVREKKHLKIRAVEYMVEKYVICAGLDQRLEVVRGIPPRSINIIPVRKNLSGQMPKQQDLF